MKVRDLIILGGSVHGAEMVEIVERCNQLNPQWNLRGFLVRKRKDGVSDLNGVPILGTLADLPKFSEAAFIPDYDCPRDFGIQRERLISVIDPSSFVSRSAQIGAGTVIYPNCFVGLNARIGEMVFCLSGCTINHDDVLEDRVTLTSGVTLAGFVTIESDCYLGQRSSVREYLRIGRGSMLGMGSVIVKDVPPNSVMVGNPARRLRDHKKVEQISIAQTAGL